MAPEGILIGVAGGLVVWQAVEFLAMSLRQMRSNLHRPNQSPVRRPLTASLVTQEAGIGFGMGLVGGAAGLILGSIRLPALIRLLKMDPKVAAGTNLVIGFLMGSFGFIGHGLRGDIDVPLLMSMVLTGMAGTYLGPV